MTRLIGLGSSCIVAQRLRIAQLSQETHIFDWITSSFQTVLNVLRCVNAQDFVNKLTTNIEFKSEPFEGNRVINCPQLGKFESYHDLPFDFDETLFQEHFVNQSQINFFVRIDCVNVFEKLVEVFFTNTRIIL